VTGLTADHALEACRALGLDPRADEHSDSHWTARCPTCILSTVGTEKRPLSITETNRGTPARIECRSGCDKTDLAHKLRAAIDADKSRPTPIRFLDVAAMVAAPPPPVAWLAPPVLPRASLTAIYAPGGDGKSLFAAALACAIAQGSEVAGIACDDVGTTLYLDGENGEHEIWRRVHTLGMPSEGVRVADASGFDLRRDLDYLAELVEEQRPDLVVLDSFRSLTPGLDENDTKQTAAVLDPLRRLAHQSGAAVLLIHHANKAGRDFRGASSIRDSVDVLWHLGRHDDDQDRTRRFLTCRKMRVAAEPDRMWLRLEIDRGRVLVDQAEPPDELVLNTAARQPVRAALSDSILAAMNGAPSRLAEIAQLVGRGPKDGSVRNALAALVVDGMLTREGFLYVKVQPAQSGAGDTDCTVAPQGASANPLSDGGTLHPPSTDPYMASVQGDAP
jgi:AAA domain